MIRTLLFFIAFMYMKNEIEKLRKKGKSYNEIKDILGCSKSTISYYCGLNQKEKTKARIKKRRLNPMIQKLDNYKYKNINESVRKFQKTEHLNEKRKINSKVDTTFNIDDVLNKIGNNPICYLSGEKINLNENNYSFDHIIPVSKGGDNSLENLGLTISIVNRMKSDMTVDEFIEQCIKVLKYNGYNVTK